ncbi:MAG: glycoside hydrolase family 172 protein [Tangfeifania sp.]
MKTIFVFLIIFGFVRSVAGQDLKYEDVVYRMLDLKRLATLPAEGEKSGMFSSYDRRSEYDEDSGYVEWAANNDGFTPQFIRKEGENMVLAEMEGPGAIVRIWSASPKEGHVKIYIDGNETPVIDMPFIDYFNTSKLPAFQYPQLVYETDARGFNSYVPITFQDSIKIVGEPEWGQYYHFNYIKFPDGTSVEEFDTDPAGEAQKALQHVNHFFERQLGTTLINNPGLKTEVKSITVSPGEEKVVFKLEGNRAVTDFKVRLPKQMQQAELMRKTVLSVFWDGEDEPSVWSPLGDFFGSAPGFNEYRTLPMGMTDKDEMYSYWYMPFAEQAEIRLKNNATTPVEMEVEVVHEENPLEKSEFGYFHAKWHRDILPVDSVRWPDWTVLKTTGKGRFVGMFLSVWNPKGGSCRQFGGEGHHWWGEGDEKFFVDGENFPSTFGTGTEDYFGYAWCIPHWFEHAFHSQNYTEDNMGYQSLNRWQIIDNVPFQESFDAYLEKYFPNDWPTQYATVAYWYLGEGGTDRIEKTPPGELYGYEIQYDVFRAEHAFEGENMQIEKNTGGWASNDVFADERLCDEVSGHKVFSWFAAKGKENKLKLSFHAKKTGKYRIFANVVRTGDGGFFDVRLNETELEPLNFHTDNEMPSVKLVEIGTLEMTEGEQFLNFNWISKDDAGNRLQLDYLKFEPLD